MSSPAFLPIIEGLWVRNYKALKQIALGSSFLQTMVMDVGMDLTPYELTPLTTIIGSSGCGKSTLLEVFAFLRDCIEDGIDSAIERRGGFDAIYHRGGEGPISIGLVYRACAEPRPITYALSIDRRPGSSSAHVETEAIVYRSSHHGASAQPILFFQNGEKTTRHVMPWHGAKSVDLDKIKRIDHKHLALKELAEYEDLPDVPQLKQHLDRFHLACYTPDSALGLTPPLYRPLKSDRLLDEFKRMKEKHGFEFPAILEVIGKRIPGVEKIYFETTESGKTVLFFKMIGEEKPYYAHQVSEGTLRLFCHMLLFEDPMPLPLIGIEEPAAYMDADQMQALSLIARDFVQEMGGSQFFITSNLSTFADFMDPTEVWILYRDSQGDVKPSRALDELAFNGVDLATIGPYWYTDHLYRKSF